MTTEPSNRRRARELALQILFQRGFVVDLDLDATFAYFREQLEIPEDSWAYGRTLVTGLLEKQESIDQKITSASPNWKLARMAPVDLNLIRIAIYETILSDDRVPPRVAINEAVEIAKRYGGSESPNFVNGILSEIFKAEGIHLGN